MMIRVMRKKRTYGNQLYGDENQKGTIAKKDFGYAGTENGHRELWSCADYGHTGIILWLYEDYDRMETISALH